MSLVVTIIEGIAGVALRGVEEIINSPGEVIIEMSILATREAGLVGSTTSVGELGLVITSRPVVAGAEDTARMKTGPLIGSG